MRGPVHNAFPLTEPGAARLALIGEAPGATEVTTGVPFTGNAGWVLDQALGHAGIARSQCFIGNVCQHRPSDSSDDFALLDWNGPEVQAGIAQLRVDLELFKPTLVVCLGNAALNLLKAGNVAPPRSGRQIKWPHPIGSWRGSLFYAKEPEWLLPFREFEDYAPVERPLKCLATFHPAALFHQWTWQAYLKVDMARAREEARTPELVLPHRVVHEMTPANGWDASRVVQVIDGYRERKRPVSVDSEGTTTWVPCVGFSDNPELAHVAVFSHPDGSHVWAEDEEVAIWEAIARLLEDPTVPKVMQNYLHDAFVFAWTCGIVVDGLVDDTMVEWWELNCELDKALEVQASVLTREPFWKSDQNYRERLAWLCGVDAACTLECHQRMGELLEEQACRQRKAGCQRTSLDHYHFYRRLLPPLNSMQLEGLPYDKAQARQELARTRQEIHRLQHRVNRAAWVATGSAASSHHARARLIRFFAAVEGTGGPNGDTGSGSSRVDNPEPAAGEGSVATGRDAGLLALVASTLCQARPRERREVTEERWQPMRWRASKTGGRWMKAGKLFTGPYPGPATPALFNDPRPTVWGIWEVAPTDANGLYIAPISEWLKPAHRTLERSVEVPLLDWPTAGRFVLESKREEFKRARAVCRELEEVTDDRDALLGELSTLLGLHLNVDSTSQGGDCQWLLYEHLTIPSRWERGGWTSYGPLTQTGGWPVVRWEARLQEAPGGVARRRLPRQVDRDTGRLTTNDTAILRIYQACQDERVLDVLRLRRLLTATETLAVAPDPDGRMRCSYILPGTETARIACHTSATGSGYNLQTTTDSQRHLFRAPPFWRMAQADLKGSDAWTVAAHAAALGDPTYWDDLVAGLKPAKIITVMGEVGTVPAHYANRADLAELCKRVDGNHWKYYANKRVGHASSYGAGDQTTADQILTDSFKETGDPVVVSTAYCRQVREGCFFRRYPGILRWHEQCRRRLVVEGALQHSSGFLRHFHGRKTEVKGGRTVANHGTWKEWLAHEPQVATTWATLMALLRCWEDPDNHLPDGTLRAKPIHTVHDSLLWLFRAEDEEWFRGRLPTWFDNPQEIAGRMVTIPCDLQVGTDWSMA